MSDDDISDSDEYISNSEPEDALDETEEGAEDVVMHDLEGDEMDETGIIEEKSNGKKFQKDRWQLKHLPYYEDIMEEADEHFCRIKEGLANSILLREIKPSFTVWLKEFETYFDQYGYRFTKQDHIFLVKLAYGILECENLEYRLIKNAAIILTVLGKRRELLNYKDIALDWKVLYRVYDRVVNKHEEDRGKIIYPKGLRQSLEHCAQAIRQFFPPLALFEMTEELRQHMCIFDNTVTFATNTLVYFAPFNFDAEDHKVARTREWFEEIWMLAKQLETRSDFPIKLLQLFARLTRESPFVIDWADKEEYLFTRLMTALSLGVTSENISLGDASTSMIEAIAQIVIFSLDGKKKCSLKHIIKFFRTIESYYHPSNLGSHTTHLMTVLAKFSNSMCSRLYREKIGSKSSFQPFPESKKMDNEVLEEFVNIFIKPCKFATYSKSKSTLVVPTIKSLTFICPGIMIPTVIDMVYQGLETITEPHRLTQSLSLLHAIIIPLVRDSYEPDSKKTRLKVTAIPYDHPEGLTFRLFALELMNALINVIDMNDMHKTTHAFNALCNFFTLIPIVDCSEAIYHYNNLTEDEKILCQGTANFETMICNLFDKFTSLVESMGNQTLSGEGQGEVMTRRAHKLNMEEQLTRKGLSCIFQALLGNCSKDFNEMIITKIFNFIKSCMFNNKAAALILKDLIAVCIRFNCDFAFPMFFKHLYKMTTIHLTKDVLSEDEPDVTFTWYFSQLISCINAAQGKMLLKHSNEIEDLIQRILHFKSALMHPRIAEFITGVLSRLCLIQLDNSSINYFSKEKPLEEELPIRNWAKPLDKDKVATKFYVPSNEEITFAEHLFTTYCVPLIETLKNPSELKDREMVKNLTFIFAFLEGVAFRLPYITGKKITIDKSYINPSLPDHVCYPKNMKNITLPDGSSVRIYLLNVIVDLIDYILEKHEDNTRAITKIASILSFIIFSRGMFKNLTDSYAQSYEITRKMLNDPIRGRKMDLETIHHDHMFLLHLKRVQLRSSESFTEHHWKGIRAAWRMTLSTYTTTRCEAQTIISNALTIYNESAKFLIDDVLKYVDVKAKHEQLKGALHNILTGKRFSILMRQNWDMLNKMIPKLIMCQSTTRESITTILDDIHNFLTDNFETFNIRYTVPDNIVKLAENLYIKYDGCVHYPKHPKPSNEEIILAKKREEENNLKKEKLYYQLWDSLCSFVTDTSLHWRHREVSFSTMGLLLRKDMRVPDKAVHLFLKQIISDEAYSREEALNSLQSWLFITLPKAKTKEYIIENERPVGKVKDGPLPIGYRKDNEFLLVNDEVNLYTSDNWNNSRCFKYINIGYYGWPKNKHALSPPIEQNLHNRKFEDYEKIDQEVITILCDPKFIKKFIEIYVHEEKKGDRLRALVYTLFITLFSKYNILFFDAWKDEIERLLENKESGHQRLAAEFFTGPIDTWAIWTFEKVEYIWKWMEPLLYKTILNMNSENQNHWCTAISIMCNKGDSRFIKCIIDLTVKASEVPSETNFHNNAKIAATYYAIYSCSWKAPSQWNKLSKICFSYLENSYQSVRDRITDVFSTTASYALESTPRDPELDKQFDALNHKEILRMLSKECYSQLEPNVYIDIHRQNNKSSPNGSVCPSRNESYNNLQATPEERRALQYFKVMVDFVATTAHNNELGLSKDIINTIPILAHYENDCDVDLAESCHAALLMNIARGYINEETCIHFLKVIKKSIETCFLWKAKVSLFKVLQVNIFSNIFIYEKHADQVFEIILPLLLSDRLEICNIASESLTGFVMCGYLKVTDNRLKTFYSWASSDNLQQRHAGALALSSVVLAYPYNVPNVMPDILMHLARMITDEQHIARTVKKTFSEFKRTHWDNWVEHKECFNENQLLVLNDLLVSPTYYV
uniref:Proteasome activator complex subunit 4 n=1 Tax=Parastrongyloides trichosuri TaxID=131310 RepID=A0A0N4ZP99_PARTI